MKNLLLITFLIVLSMNLLGIIAESGEVDITIPTYTNVFGQAFHTITITEDITVSDVNILINISHPIISQIGSIIVEHNGDHSYLSGSIGPGASYCNTIFDDQATIEIQNGTAPFLGRYIPMNFLTQEFAGKSAQGDWTISAVNSDIYDTGTIHHWEVRINELNGEGTEANPYKISSITSLKELSSESYYWNKIMIQTADIDASNSIIWNNEEGFSPIGTLTENFTGKYDGQLHKISGLYIYRASNDQGLFGFAEGAELSNIIIQDCNITSQHHVGGIAGHLGVSGVIENCSVSGSIEGEYAIGGLVGRLDDSNCYNSFSSAIVTSVNNAQRAGGLVGYGLNGARISDSYSSGTVTGSNKAGGLVGEFDTSIIEYSYSSGEVNCSGSNLGGLIGYFVGGDISSFIYDSYWNTETSNQSTSNGGTGITIVQMQDQDFYPVSWDFDTTWEIDQNYNSGFPILQWHLKKPVVITTSAHDITSSSVVTGGNVTSANGFTVTARGVCFSTSPNPTLEDNYTTNGTGIGEFTSSLTALSKNTEYFYRAYATNSQGTSYGDEYSFITYPAGSGIISDPYQISSLNGLLWLSETPAEWDKYFGQTADIDATDTQNWNSLAGFSPIGNSTNPFTGNYNGQGYEISNLFINRSSSTEQGLFGQSLNCSILNTNLQDCNITGNDGTAGLVGHLENGTITCCSSSGTVSGDFAVGGLVGRAINSTISECYSTATAGCIFDGDRTGGLVGYVNSGSNISNCYARGTVSGDNKVGGLIGNIKDSSVEYCYSTGTVSCTNSSFGGLIGILEGSSTITASFWNTETSGQSTSNGGIGKTTSQMTSKTTYTNAGWDFTNVWSIYAYLNDSYPIIASVLVLPQVRTTIATNVLFTSADSGGEVLDEGLENVTARGVCWSELPHPTLNDNFTTDGNGLGEFSSYLTDIEANTEYFYRAYATSSEGTSYGEEYSFTTLETKAGNCLSFNGGEDYYVELPYILNPGTDNFTIELWFNVDITSGSQILVQQSDPGGRSIIYLDGNDLRSYLGGSTFSANTSITVEDWYHVALTYDGADLKFYVNGMLTNTSTRSLESSSGTLRLGTSKSNSSFFDGKMDELRIWNVAHEAHQIRDNMYQSLVGNENNLVAFYNFNSEFGTTLHDITGNEYDGTLQNTMTWNISDTFTTWHGRVSSDWFTAENWSDGVPDTENNIGICGGSNSVEISNSPSLRNVVVGSSASITLSSGFTVNRKLFLENDLNFNGQTITMAPNATLYEDSGNLTGSSGSIKTTRILGTLSSNNIGGLGAEITTNISLGETTITRSHTQQTGAGGTAIRRYYDIDPNTHTGLNATLVFHYNDVDISGYTESDLTLWKSEDEGSTWTEMGRTGAVDTVNNTITLDAIDSFSRWTANDGDHPLPVTLSSFTGTLDNSIPALNWTTESELENLGWNIYRSETENGLENNNSIMLNNDLIPGMGTVSIPTDYLFIDEIPIQQTGIHYYWLESVSYSGELEIYGPVSLNLNDSILLASTPIKSFVNNNYPNPFNPTTKIEFGIKEGEKGSLTIYNIKGQIVRSQKYESGFHTFTWDASKQASGVYFYQLKTSSYYKTYKMIMLK